MAPALVSGGFLQSDKVIKVHWCNSDVPVSLSQDSGNYVTKSTFQAYVFDLTFWRCSEVATGPQGIIPQALRVAWGVGCRGRAPGTAEGGLMLPAFGG